MKEKLADMIFLSIREARSIEELAERLVERGVQIVPEGAMILTRAELDALNKYQERFKGQDAEAVIATEVAKEIFAEIDERLDDITIVMGRLDSLHTFHKTMEKVTAEVTELKKKYTEGGE